MATSAGDTITGPFSAGWSQTAWTVQTLVSAAQTAATGGTYALEAPVEESVPEAKKAVKKPRAKKNVQADRLPVVDDVESKTPEKALPE